LGFSADGKEIIAVASSEHLLEICDVVLRLLAVSVVHSVKIYKWNPHYGELINAPTLAYLMEQCQSLKFLSLYYLEIDENHCRVLGTYSRPGLEIELVRCEITSGGASTLAEVLGCNQGPTKLDYCKINNNSILADGLRGNSRLKVFRAETSRSRDVGNQELLAITGALRENKGLLDLDLTSGFTANEETWDAVCDSLKTHPTLEILDLRSTFAAPTTDPAVIRSRVEVLLDMLKVNTSIHTLRLDSPYREHEIFRELVIPRLETNRFRPRLLAIQKARPIGYRAKVVGKALLSIRTDANHFWMLLSGNAEVAFSSRTTTIAAAAAANLPLSTTAAATSTENDVSVLATTSTADAVAPVAGQKRKACP
jgi:hypothetical protein